MAGLFLERQNRRSLLLVIRLVLQQYFATSNRAPEFRLTSVPVPAILLGCFAQHKPRRVYLQVICKAVGRQKPRGESPPAVYRVGLAF